jgi:hypothetical protein
MVDSLAKLSVDIYDGDLVYSLLLVLSGMLMDEKGEIICTVLLYFYILLQVSCLQEFILHHFILFFKFLILSFSSVRCYSN